MTISIPGTDEICILPEEMSSQVFAPKEKLICKLCGSTETDTRAMRRHQRRCRRLTPAASEAASAEGTGKQSTPYDEPSRTRRTLHPVGCGRNSAGGVRCGSCGATITNARALRRHQRRHHQLNQRAESPDDCSKYSLDSLLVEFGYFSPTSEGRQLTN